MLNSEIVYLTCLRPNTLKTIPCSAAHTGWGQIGEYPLAKLTFLSGFRIFWGGHFLCFLSKHFLPPPPFSCCGIHNVCCLSTWGPSSCQVGEDPGNKIGLKAEVLFIVIWVYTLYQRGNHLIFALFTVTFHGNRSTTQFIGIFSLQAVECWLTWRLKTNLFYVLVHLGVLWYLIASMWSITTTASMTKQFVSKAQGNMNSQIDLIKYAQASHL